MFLFYTVGIPASGKDSFYQTLLDERKNDPDASEIVHISSDKIRGELYGDESCQDNPAAVFAEMEKRTLAALAARKDIYYNACSINAKRRINFIKNIVSRLPKLGIRREELHLRCFVFATPFRLCYKRNNERKRVVPDEAMWRMYTNFVPPHKSEGWNDVIIVTPRRKDGLNLIVEDIEMMKDFDQCNHHHTLTLGNHMIAAQKWAMEHEYPYKVIVAAAIHDIGKYDTQDFQDRKGEATEEAHYFNHANVGAYIALANRWSANDDFWLDVANLIVHHMDFFGNCEAYLEKIKARYGEEFFQELCMLHNADINAK